MGWIHQHHIDALLPWEGRYFLWDKNTRIVHLNPHLQTQEVISRALDEVVITLQQKNMIGDWSDERFGVDAGCYQHPLATIKRVATGFFGITTYGTHLNGLVKREDEWFVWLAKRASYDGFEAGKWDNMAAGGLPIQYTPIENMIIEAGEEAKLPRAMSETMVPVGSIAYTKEYQEQLHPDVMFCFDVLLPEDFIPQADGQEIQSFELVSAKQLLIMLERQAPIKFNSSLVMIDTLIRHHVITPDYPDYDELVQQLRRPLHE